LSAEITYKVSVGNYKKLFSDAHIKVRAWENYIQMFNQHQFNQTYKFHYSRLYLSYYFKHKPIFFFSVFGNKILIFLT